MQRLLYAVFFAFLGAPAIAQPPRAAFDVTSIHLTPQERHGLLQYEKCNGGGTFIARGTPLQWLLEFAYAAPDTQVTGGPSWLGSFSLYDIEGKPDHKVTDAECRAMVRSLLQDRFKLQTHSELREVPAFALVVGPHGHKLQPAKPTSAGGGVHINGALQQGLSETEAPDGWSMSKLASLVADFVHRPVVDRTNLPGNYSFSIRFAHTLDSSDPAIATALQDDLGLKLEPVKANQTFIIVDHIEKPEQN